MAIGQRAGLLCVALAIALSCLSSAQPDFAKASAITGKIWLDYQGVAKDFRSSDEVATEEKAFNMSGAPQLTRAMIADEEEQHRVFGAGDEAPIEFIYSSDGKHSEFKVAYDGKLQRVVLMTTDGIYDIHFATDPPLVYYGHHGLGMELGNLPFIATSFNGYSPISNLAPAPNTDKSFTRMRAECLAAGPAVGLPFDNSDADLHFLMVTDPTTKQTNPVLSNIGLSFDQPLEQWELKDEVKVGESLVPATVGHRSSDPKATAGSEVLNSYENLKLAAKRDAPPASDTFSPESFVSEGARLEYLGEAGYVLAKYEDDGSTIVEQLTHHLPVDDAYGEQRPRKNPSPQQSASPFSPGATPSRSKAGLVVITSGVLFAAFVFGLMKLIKRKS